MLAQDIDARATQRKVAPRRQVERGSPARLCAADRIAKLVCRFDEWQSDASPCRIAERFVGGARHSESLE